MRMMIIIAALNLVLIAATLIGSNFAIARANAGASNKPQTFKLQTPQLIILRVTVRNPADIALLTTGGYDVLEARDKGALFVIGDENVAESLKAKGFDVTLHTNLQTQTFQPFSYYGGYRTVAEHYAHMDAIATAHPDLALVVDYGDSWRKLNNAPNGHDLKAICITKRRPQDCQLNSKVDKPRFFLMAAIHARELSTSEMAWRWMDYLIDNYGVDADITALLDANEMWIVPTANPDGRFLVEQGGNAPYLQRKNLNNSAGDCGYPPGDDNYVSFQPGVDLNRNAAFKWGVSGSTGDPCYQTYHGAGPASEPEEQALESLMQSLFPDQRGALDTDGAPITATGAMLTLHSYGDLVLLPWGWTECFNQPCPTSKQAPDDAGLRAFAFRLSYYNGYPTGQASELLYAASGTTDDWAYGALGIPGFTFEIGPANFSDACWGFTPPYSCQDNRFWPLNRGAFLYAAKLSRQPYALALGPNTMSVTVSSATVITGAPVALMASVDDAALGNHPDSVGRPAAQSIAAAEYYIDTPPWAGGAPVSMSAQDGGFDNAVEVATALVNTTGLGVGRHILFVRGRDADDHWGPVTAQWLSVLGDKRTYLPFFAR